MAARIMRIERYERIRFGIISAAAAIGELVFHDLEAAHGAFHAIRRHAEQIDAVTGFEVTVLNLARVEEDDIALTEDAAVAIRERIQGRVVLIVATHGG